MRGRPSTAGLTRRLPSSVELKRFLRDGPKVPTKIYAFQLSFFQSLYRTNSFTSYFLLFSTPLSACQRRKARRAAAFHQYHMPKEAPRTPTPKPNAACVSRNSARTRTRSKLRSAWRTASRACAT